MADVLNFLKDCMTRKSTTLEYVEPRVSTPIVVVADDNRDNLGLIGFVLDALSLKHYLADNGEAALSSVNRKRPYLVVLDVVMPKMNGIGVVVYLRANPLTRHTPAIAIVALAEPKHLLAIKSAGFNDYLVKPFLAEDLETKLRNQLKTD